MGTQRGDASHRCSSNWNAFASPSEGCSKYDGLVQWEERCKENAPVYSLPKDSVIPLFPIDELTVAPPHSFPRSYLVQPQSTPPTLTHTSCIVQRPTPRAISPTGAGGGLSSLLKGLNGLSNLPVILTQNNIYYIFT